jgi:hypothetical protein
MGKQHAPLLSFNRGEVSRYAMARVDIERMRLSAEEQVNWAPWVLGPMMLRPGLQHCGGINDDLTCRLLPFIFLERHGLAGVDRFRAADLDGLWHDRNAGDAADCLDGSHQRRFFVINRLDADRNRRGGILGHLWRQAHHIIPGCGRAGAGQAHRDGFSPGSERPARLSHRGRSRADPVPGRLDGRR